MNCRMDDDGKGFWETVRDMPGAEKWRIIKTQKDLQANLIDLIDTSRRNMIEERDVEYYRGMNDAACGLYLGLYGSTAFCDLMIEIEKRDEQKGEDDD